MVLTDIGEEGEEFHFLLVPGEHGDGW